MRNDMQATRHTWAVGALCRAVADLLDARLGAVTVQGEISGFSRAASGHCYFSLKDTDGQLRCAMFRRAAGLLDWFPREGDQVEVRGRLAVYEARGDLQLVVESMRRSGQGALHEDFLRRKAALQAQGLFDPARKRSLAAHPRGIGLVTSAGAAALRDVATALRRRAPHVPVLLVPAQVQGPAAPEELVGALQRLYALIRRQRDGEATPPGVPFIDTILLVRGGGSLEDLWAFNDVELAHAIVQSPVPVVAGIGHETDFTIADFCADVRAPTPTAAAELAAMPAQEALQQAVYWQHRLQQRVQRQLEQQAQALDRVTWGLTRTAAGLGQHRLLLQRLGMRLQQAPRSTLQQHLHGWQHLRMQLEQALSQHPLRRQYGLQLQHLQQRLSAAVRQPLQEAAHGLAWTQRHWHTAWRERIATSTQRLQMAETRLHLLHPGQTLQRGYAILQDQRGKVLTSRTDFHAGQEVHATVQDGEVLLTPVARQQPMQEQ